MKINIFPILGFEITDDNCSGNFSSGTGFLIDNEGHFFTAGHNFYKSKERGSDTRVELACFALINNKLIRIENPYIECDNDQEKIKCDFATGKIDISTESHLGITLDLENNIECVLLGYSIRNLPYEVVHTISFKNSEFKLYRVPIKPTSNEWKYFNFVISYENVLFYEEDKNVDLSGLSGCPVIKNESYIGILTSNFFITRDYAEKVFDERIKNSTQWSRLPIG